MFLTARAAPGIAGPDMSTTVLRIVPAVPCAYTGASSAPVKISANISADVQVFILLLSLAGPRGIETYAVTRRPSQDPEYPDPGKA